MRDPESLAGPSTGSVETPGKRDRYDSSTPTKNTSVKEPRRGTAKEKATFPEYSKELHSEMLQSCKMAILPTGYPETKLIEEQANAIQDVQTVEVLAFKKELSIPQFTHFSGTYLDKGAVLMDERSRNRLLETFPDLAVSGDQRLKTDLAR